MKKYDGIIFDFNGTLYWDTEYHDKAWIEFTRKYVGKKLTKEELDNTIHGLLNKSILQNLFQRSLNSDEVEKYSGLKEQLYQQFCIEDEKNLKLSPGATELFDFLKTKKIPFTIASSANESNIKFYFKTFHLNRWFDFNKIVYDDGHIEGKPSPQPFFLAAQKLGLTPAECIVVEDSDLGIQAARNAGTGYIYCISTMKKPSDMADEVIKSLKYFNRDLLF